MSTQIIKGPIKAGIYLKNFPHLGYVQEAGLDFKKEMVKVLHQVPWDGTPGMIKVKTRKVHVSELAYGAIKNAPRVFTHEGIADQKVSEFPVIAGQQQTMDKKAIEKKAMKESLKNKRGPKRKSRGMR